VPVLGHHKLRKLTPAHVRQWTTRKLTEPSAAVPAQHAAWDRVAAEKAARRAKKAAERAIWPDTTEATGQAHPAGPQAGQAGQAALGAVGGLCPDHSNGGARRRGARRTGQARR